MKMLDESARGAMSAAGLSQLRLLGESTQPRRPVPSTGVWVEGLQQRDVREPLPASSSPSVSSCHLPLCGLLGPSAWFKNRDMQQSACRMPYQNGLISA